MESDKEQLVQRIVKLKQLEKQVNQYSEEIGTIMSSQKKMFKIKEKLVKPKEPVLFLNSPSGRMRIFHNVRESEWSVPDLPHGIEKKIILGQPWQEEIPWAGQTFKGYWCHTDYAFPHKWGKPNLYIGQYPEKIKTWINDRNFKFEVAGQKVEGIPIILETANINSEAMRDRERKVLVAWEKFTTSAHSLNIKAWGKFILWAGCAAALVIFAWSFFGPKDPTPEVQAATGIIVK